MKHSGLFFIVLILCATAFLPFYNIAADQRLDKIRELYNKIQELDCGDACAHFRHEIVYNTMFPAIGLQTTAVQFFYYSGQVDPETDPYLLSHMLMKVKVTYNIAASAYYTIEYLYDEQGDLVFYYWMEEQAEAQGEKRFYFHNKKLIKVIVDCNPWDGDPVKYEDVKNFKAEDVREAASLVQKALDYKKLFETLITAEQWK
ncbi:MAG: hypothetical protein JW822_05040 [Spirochaetales bacterium]|nr:hypothetical protein [Spirochaetales bacterium]